MADMVINTVEVMQMATELEQLNGRLTDELDNCKKTVDQLIKEYQGDAAQATIDVFDAFAAKYFESYKNIINQYVQFLRNNVAEGYSDTIGTNITLAESFK